MSDESVEEFCRRVSPRLVGSLALHCGDQNIAEDIAQDALARAWEKWPDVSAMASPEGWVFRVAFNLSSSHWRRRRAEQRAYDRLGTGRATTADSSERVALRDALRSLSPRQRAAIVLRYYADLSVAATAVALDCAPGTVKSLASQGLANLRAALTDEQLGVVEVLPDA